MKKAGLFLLAVVMVAGFAGCGGGGGNGDDFSPSISNMAGVYNLTKLTVTQGEVHVELVPPEISGTMTLYANGTGSIDLTVRGERFTGTGTWAVLDDTIVLDDGEVSGPITDGGRKFSLNLTFDGAGTYEFTRA